MQRKQLRARVNNYRKGNRRFFVVIIMRVAVHSACGSSILNGVVVGGHSGRRKGECRWWADEVGAALNSHGHATLPQAFRSSPAGYSPLPSYSPCFTRYSWHFGTLCSLTTLAISDPLARRETVAFFRAEFDRNKHLLDLVRLWSCHFQTPAQIHQGRH